MKIDEKKKNKDSFLVTIEGDLDIYNVKEIKESINKHLSDSYDLELDLSKIQKIDTAGFQLIMFIKNEKLKTQKKFNIVKPSQEVISIFETYKEKLN